MKIMKMNRIRLASIYLVAVSAFFLLSINIAFADVIEIQPGPADGQDTALHNGLGNYASNEALPSGGWGDTYTNFFKFNLDTAPASSDTVSAKFFVWGLRPGNGHDPALELYRITSNWTDSTVSADNPSTIFYKTMPVMMPNNDTYGWVQVDITDLYKAWKDGTYPNYGVELIPTNVDHSNGAIFASENLDVVHRPKLVIATTGVAQNHAPTLDAIGNKVITAGQTLQFVVTASDPDGDIVTLAASNVPAGAKFNPQNGVFSWTTAISNIGTYSGIQFVATDTGYPSMDGSEAITITVNPPPDVTAPVAAPIQSMTVDGQVKVDWNWTEEVGGSGIDSANCAAISIAPNADGTVLNVTCKDITGNIGAVSYTVRSNLTQIRPGPRADALEISCNMGILSSSLYNYAHPCTEHLAR